MTILIKEADIIALAASWSLDTANGVAVNVTGRSVAWFVFNDPYMTRANVEFSSAVVFYSQYGQVEYLLRGDYDTMEHNFAILERIYLNPMPL